MKAITDVECGVVSEEIGNSESRGQDEIETTGFFRNLPCEIGPKGTSGEFGIGPDSVQCDKGIFNFRGEAEAVREKRFLELDIDHFSAERDLTSIPTVAHWVGDGHHPGGHQGRTLLLGCVILCESMREHVAGSEPDFLRANGDFGRYVCSLRDGGGHE